MADDIFERLLAEADIVITGAADCGSCTAYTVHDAIELEAAGKPAVVVTTTKFEPIADTLSASFGLPDTRLLVLPHPIGGTDEPTLARVGRRRHRPPDRPVHRRCGERRP